MFLKSGVNDISDDEFELIISQHGDIVNQFVEEYIMPEVIAFYLATGYYGSCMYEESLQIHINSIIAEVFNSEEEDRPRLIDNIKKILRIKYGLIVINEDPLDFACY